MPAAFVTLLTLRDRCRAESDQQNSSLVEDTELNQYINTAIQELMDFLIALEDHPWESRTVYWYIPANYEACYLPCDFYNMISLEYTDAPSTSPVSIPMRPFMQWEKHQNRDRTWDLGDPPQYRISTIQPQDATNTQGEAYVRDAVALTAVLGLGANNDAPWIQACSGEYLPDDAYYEPPHPFQFRDNETYGHYVEFNRKDPSRQYLRLTYHPRTTPLSSDAHVFLDYNGYADFVVASAAIKMLSKEESDITALSVRKAEIKERLKDMGTHRDTGMPQRAIDVRRPMVDIAYIAPTRTV